MGTKTALSAAALASALAVTGCAVGSSTSTSREGPAPAMSMEASYPLHPDFESLAAAADAVFVGRIGPVSGREVDRGSEGVDDPAAPPGIPLVFHRVQVEEVLMGDVEGEPVVAWIDRDAVDVADLSDLREGDHVLLFCVERGPGDSGIRTVRSFFPVSGDNGVFDVTGTTVVARSADFLGSGVGAPTDGSRYTASLDAVRAALGLAPAAGG